MQIFFIFRGSETSEKKQAFRKWYAQLYEFKCLLDSAAKFALFAATTTNPTKWKILGMVIIDASDTTFIEMNPNKDNIKYQVVYIDINDNLISTFMFAIEDIIKKMVYKLIED